MTKAHSFADGIVRARLWLRFGAALMAVAISLCLCAVPTYQLLLDKFPDAEISLEPA